MDGNVASRAMNRNPKNRTYRHQMQQVAVILIITLSVFQHQNDTLLGASALAIGSNGGGKKRRAKTSNKSAVDAIALKIGLNVVVPKLEAVDAEQDTSIHIKKMRHEEIVKRGPPSIVWGKKARRFFWGSNSRIAKHLSSTGRQLNVERIYNDQEFPLYQIHKILPRQSLEQAVSSLMDDEKIYSAEELEQHEWVRGKPRALRRSLVSQLNYSSNDNNSREIMDLILAGLPADLVEGTNAPFNEHPHPYEDGSIVYYRANGNDFYHAHHDSYDPDYPQDVRKHQRAYTILLYLRVPHGSERVGGTEFPKLSNGSISDVLVVKPKAGDAIVWPNFNQDGKPYLDSIHGALPIVAEKNRSISRSDGCNKNEDEVGKIVINLWFEGYTKRS